MDRAAPTTTETIVVALGCFWDVEAALGALEGVVCTTVGFAGGRASDPTYAGIEDHAEAVCVEYDPTQLCYAALLDRFWTTFDPTLTPVKRRYQPLLVPQTERQTEQAQASRAERVEIIDDGTFHPGAFHSAALRHQKHMLRRHPTVFEPFRAMYPADRALADAPAAALANGYAGGYRAPARLDDDASRLGLPAEATRTLRTIAKDRHRA